MLILERQLNQVLFITNQAFYSMMRHKYINMMWILMAFLHEILFMSVASSDISMFGNESDRLALLDLRRRIQKDPHNIMSSWNDSMPFCNWVGITCNTTTGRVLVLNLRDLELTGSLPPSLGNLTYLTEISLVNNYLHGPIPQEFGRLLQLRHLKLTFNDFSGKIPVNISHCTQLVNLRLGRNNLTGIIPSWIGNFSSMLGLSLAGNNFQGRIPSELGYLSRLQLFTVYENNLSGTVPSSIYNITSLTYFSLTQNRLQGNLPPNVGFTLPSLQVYAGGVNNFWGPIPKSLANASGLQILDFAENGLTGMIPDNLGSLKDLERLNFDDNRLGSGKVGDLNLINSLANCTSLKVLGLSGNRFGGALPPFIANLSTQLTYLGFGRNMLSGSIPTGIENLVNLQELGLEGNYFNGSIPHIIGKLRNLRVLELNDNRLSQSIPSSLGNLSSLTRLFMENNKLEGSIPPSLGQCKSLQVLDLSGNSLNGTIPKEVLSLSSLSIYLALNHNSLIGPFPSEVGQLVSLTLLDVSENKLSGEIPSNLGRCISMGRLRLGGNQFEGKIPQSLEALRGLEELNLSSNNFSGKIPEFLGKILTLKLLDLSYNHFEGEVPKVGIFSNSTMVSIFGNNNLCDGLLLHLPPCPANRTHSSHKFLAPKFFFPVLGTITFLVVLVSVLCVCFMVKKTRKSSSTLSSSKDLLPQISYFELSRSTNGFSVDTLIGSGSFGSVYKGILPGDGSIVAIKVLNLQQQGASNSFIRECKALASIRHRNLLKIISSCSSIDEKGNEFKALVFDFMSNGNLDRWLHTANHEQNQSSRLSFIQRLNIAIDIANALDYLHNQCQTPIVHCDLKPSNVLLDENMVAHVSDFGLAKIIIEESNQSSFEQTLSIALKGSIGYIPPEYGTSGRVSIEGDIYSYGILLLEMITGKRPTDESFGDGFDIRQFITAALPHRILEIVDHSQISTDFDREEEEENGGEIQEMSIIDHRDRDRREIEQRKMEECLISMIRIGISCCSKSAGERMSMNIVVKELQEIRSSYLKVKNQVTRLIVKPSYV